MERSKNPSENLFKTSRNYKIMKEEDFKDLRNWLVDHGYYIGNHEVAEALKKLADAWDD